MSTSTDTSRGLGFWKILALVILGIIVLSMIGALLKGLFWIALLALAAYGGFVLLRGGRKSSG